MGNLLLNIPAVHHSRAFRGLPKAHPGQVHPLVGKYDVGETVTAQKQPTGVQKKIPLKMSGK